MTAFQILQVHQSPVSRASAFSSASARALRYLNPLAEYSLQSADDLKDQVEKCVQDVAVCRDIFNSWQELVTHFEPELAVVGALAELHLTGGWLCDLEFEAALPFKNLHLDTGVCYLGRDGSDSGGALGLRVMYVSTARHPAVKHLLSSAGHELRQLLRDATQPPGGRNSRSVSFGNLVLKDTLPLQYGVPPLKELPGVFSRPCTLPPPPSELDPSSTSGPMYLGCLRSVEDSTWAGTLLNKVHEIEYHLRQPLQHIHASATSVQEDVPIVTIVLMVLILLFVIGVPIAIHFAGKPAPPKEPEKAQGQVTYYIS